MNETGRGSILIMLSLQGGAAERLENCAALAAQGELDKATEMLLAVAADRVKWEAISPFLTGLADEASPHGVELLRRAGSTLAQQDRFSEALDCWRRVEELCPEDQEAAEVVSQLTIAKSRQNSDLARDKAAPADNSAHRAGRQVPAPKPQPEIWFGARREVSEPVPLPSPPEITLTQTQQLEKAIRDCPAHPDNYLELVPLYLAKGRDFDAERLLAKGREATEEDPAVRRLWEDVLMLRLEKKVTIAREQVETEKTEKAQAELDELIVARDRLESEIFHNRCQREPTNPALRFELGLRLKRAGNLREAIARFQEALCGARQKCQAAFEIGDCLEQLGELPEALRQFRLSAESATEPTDIECHKRALQRSASVASQIKLPRVAQRYLAELEHLDAKDVAPRNQ